MIPKMQLRLVYSLLKPAARLATSFGIPIKSLVDMVRLAVCETLVDEGLNATQIAERIGQTPRHARSLMARLREDFFEAETNIGLLREIENVASQAATTPDALAQKLPHWTKEEIECATRELLRRERLVQDELGRVQVSARYVVLASEHFPERIDALNHFLDTTYRAAQERLLFGNRRSAMLKTISFDAQSEKLTAFMKQLEGRLRTEVADLEEESRFDGEHQRFSVGLAFTPVDER